MSEYEPKVGDRVRVAFEGEVSYVGKGEIDVTGARVHRYGTYIDPSLPGVSVEKIKPPLPTVPGSVIRATHPLCSRRHFYLTADGWECVEPRHHGFGTDAVLFKDFEVVFDAGAV